MVLRHTMKKNLTIFLMILLLCRIETMIAQVDSDFWFAVPELSYRNAYGGKPGTLRISTLELEATVTISMPANPYDPVLNPAGFQDIVISIPGNSAQSVDLSHLIDDIDNTSNNLLENKNLTADGINNFGLHISSTNLINVYWSVDYTAAGGPGGADIWTLKGSNGLGTLFYTPFQTFYPSRNTLPAAYSAIDIVASEDNTQVTITLPPGKAASYGLPMTNIAAGGIHTVTLNMGQTFSVFPLNKSIAAADRLAGTRIQSTLPIAVTLKDDAVAVGPSGADVVGDQLIPVSVTGDHYIVPAINNPNHVYVVATENNTGIYVYDPAGVPIGASPYVTLNAGQQALVIIPNGAGYARLTSSTSAADPYRPFYVFQMGIENNARGGALVPPIGCTGNTQLAFTRAFEDNKFYFFIIVEKGNEDKFLIDGTRQDGIINPGAFTEIAGSGGYMAYFSNSINSNTLPVGQHLVTNTGGIFHLGILNGFPGLGQGQKMNYGYYSDFGNLNIGASVAGTNSQIVRACYADPVQLYAFGGTVYNWTPDTYLDDATSNLPIAYNLPPGPHSYTVDVSGACGNGSINITVLVAQPVQAFFQTDVASGCSELEVNFTDQSTGAWSWRYDPGDGSPPVYYDLDPLTVAIPPPPNPFVFSHTYRNTTGLPVEHTITLLVRNESGCADFYTKTIVVFPEIEADFSVDTVEGCDPVEVTFTNNTSGNIDTWFWEFGDGGSSIEENPVHIYRNVFGPGVEVFTARLIATSPFLCRDTTYQTISVKPYIEALFTFDYVSACTPHEIEIFNQSFGADLYFWDFGDGTTSNSPDPVINKIFTNTGDVPVTYTIRLHIENDEGCFDVMERDVTVFPDVVAAFTPAPDSGCSPLNVEFVNNSTGAAYYYWEFGDGGSSTLENPVHEYDRNLTGADIVYTVKLLVTSEELCRDSAFFDIVVHPYIEAAFTAENVTACHPFDLIIDNLSVGAVYYNWDFGDGTTSSAPDPIIFHTYLNTTGATVVYPLSLIIENDQGCTDTLIRNITVHPELTANFQADLFEGCSPLTVTFTDLSLNAETWFWEFGDGASSAQQGPVHTFTNYGTSDSIYMVTLTTTSGNGLCIKSVSWPILVHGISEADFSVSRALDCTPSQITFENLSTGGINYTWDFGDGTIFSTADKGPVSHIYVNAGFIASQDFEVVLSVQNYAGCNSEARRTITVYPDIIAEFSASVTEGCHPLSVDFTNLTDGGSTFFWDFGNGSSSSLQNPSNIFTNTGTTDSLYTVTLFSTASNNTCRDTFSLDILVHPYVNASFTIPETLDCSPFDILIENNSVNASVFRWDFGDGNDSITYNTDTFMHRFYNPGFTLQQEYEITLIAENFAGCTSEARRKVTVQPDIVASFAPDQVQGCHPLAVEFTNSSQGAAYYLWDFGNGNSSALQNPSAIFTNTGLADTTYRVVLVAMAANHMCIDSDTVEITVHPLIRAEFHLMENIACSPSMVTLNNASRGAESFYWNFGDGTDTTTTDMGPVVHNFVNPGFISPADFIVTMRAVNFAGCTDEMSRTVQVYPAIEAAFSASIDEGCHPMTVNFSNESSGGFTYSWDFGDGSSTSSTSPTYTFMNFTDAPITRQVMLRAVSRFNCSSEAMMLITIHPKPVARYETDLLIACPPFDVQITNTSVNATNFTWVFGDGNILATSSPDPVNHVYDNLTAGIAGYDLKLIAQTDFGCQDSTQQKVFVYPRAVSGFSSVTEGCSPLTVNFTNESVRGFTYHWDLGDGISMGVTDPTHVYYNFSTNDTVYSVKLTTTTQYGCVDSVSDLITVFPQPRTDLTALPTHQVYPSATVAVINETSPGPWNYLWDMGDGFTTTLKDPPPHTYSHWGEYEITLYSYSASCSDTATRKIRILPTTPVAQFDPVIPDCVPLTVRFRNTSLYGSSWLWEFDDGSVSTDFEPLHTFTESGLFNVKLTVTGDGGVDFAYRMVEVYRKPIVMFKVAPSLVMLPDEEIQLFNMSEHGSTYLWDFGDGVTSVEKNPGHLYRQTGIYTITLDVWTENGCTDRMVLPDTVTVVGKGAIRYPNAFRPDVSGPNGGYYDLGDPENNRVFRPLWEGVVDYRLEIYNRWGEFLFKSEDVMIGWDGYYQGKMAKHDVYVWKVWGAFSNGRKFVLAGDVTLMR
jgi:PKD repeat protein